MPETMTRPNSLGLDAGAFALRPVRLVGDALHSYEAATFPRDAWGGCARTLRKLRALGMLAADGAGCLLDVLSDRDGTVVQDYPLSLAGLRYLVRTLRLRRDRDDSEHPAAPGAVDRG